MERKLKTPRIFKSISDFIKWESSSGFILVFTAILALILSNSPWDFYYEKLFSTELSLGYGNAILAKPFILWINDGLMAVFFLLVGLEIKRELLKGELNSFKTAILPIVAALGGMIFPAIIYLAFNYQDPIALNGWAIPSATDIAFALGVLTLLGSRVPISLKVFLTAIAILDDLGAILIIAIFYTEQLSLLFLGLAFIALIILCYLNFRGITRFFPYAIIGILLWAAVFNSGVHATLAGVALAFAYPLSDKKNPRHFPLQNLEQSLHPWVAFGVLPLFAFANAGVPLAGVSLKTLGETIPLGIICGLFFGKQLGIFSASWLCIKFNIAKMPHQATWRAIYGVSILCGIGFTMSLFIGSLAFTNAGEEYTTLVRIGVLSGSVISAIVGVLFLLLGKKK